MVEKEIFTKDQKEYLENKYVQKDKYYKKQDEVVGRITEVSKTLAVVQTELSSDKAKYKDLMTLVMFILTCIIGIYTFLAKG